MKNDAERPRYLRAKQYLLSRIKKMRPGRNQLEPENQLTVRLGICRETVRKAMSTLIEEGVITRRRGKGNFGHPEVANLKMRIDRNSDFWRILSSRGHAVRAFRSVASVQSPSAGMLRRMPEAEGTTVLTFDLDFFAADRAAIHGKVELLMSIVKTVPLPGEYSGKFNAILKEHCTTETNHTTAWLAAENAGAQAARFDLDANAALLCWEEVYYDLFDQKFGYIKVYFNPALIDLSMLLKF